MTAGRPAASPAALELRAVGGLPEVGPGSDLAALIAGRADLAGGDVVCVAHKVVSKAEGALAPLDPREPVDVQRRRVALAHARRVVVDAPQVAITETPQGLVCAQGGIDASNAPDGHLVLLPDDPDASARRIRADLRRLTGADVAVLVTDTFGRPWRLGQTDVAIGCAGLAPIRDERGRADRAGHALEVTEAAVADALAAAADLLRTKDAGVPVVVVRGLPGVGGEDGPGAAALQRPAGEDLFARGRGAVADALAAMAESDPQAGPADPRSGPAPTQGEPVPEADVARAGRAATALGATVVDVPGGPAPTRLRVQADRDDVAGAAAALLVAGLLDLGHRARLVEPARPTSPRTARGPEPPEPGAPAAGAGPRALVEAAAGP